jgi:hypothetical protein
VTPELRRVEWTVLVLAVLCLLTAAIGATRIIDLGDRVSRLETSACAEAEARPTGETDPRRRLQPSAPAGALGPLRCTHGESSIVATRGADGKLRVSKSKTTGCIP